ncbi:TetR/AcrR family transcriptional regulator [Glycomyces terrestris]|uniref:TetR/AcrR family transcriptional regulator n=1 Tax=Glycomyces terrestris TaxID=2493553 RepID=A0A426V327_9ACTN|nr:TetR/AcrR family transcriptional regulator [Glycomyces terrestris]RRS01220.1 TetR/AcrR family transcriptional regulator [Glycomyces terrestris]
MTQDTPVRDQVLEAADRLFYAKGTHAVGMDELRAAAGVSLKRLYQLFESKEALIEAVLQWRDATLTAEITAYTARQDTPERQVLAVFDWIADSSGSPGFRGCAFINAYAEHGASSERITAAVRHQKSGMHGAIHAMAAAAGRPEWVADSIFLLFEGAMTNTAIAASSEPARQARAAAEFLLDNTG